MKHKWIFGLLIVGLLVASCGGSNRIVGEWEDSDGVVYHFYKDGTLTFNSFGLEVSGTYAFVDKDSIKIELDGLLGLAGNTVFDVSFSGNQMTWEGSGVYVEFEKK